MNTRTISILDVDFEIAQPYAAGPIELSEAEAKVLNQTRAENLGNAFRRKIKEAKESENPGEALAKLREDFTAYEADYVFTLASAGSGASVLSPVEREARKLARKLLNAKIQEAGKSVKGYKAEVGDEAYEAKLAEIATMEAVEKEARRIVKETEKQISGAVGIEI